MTIALAKWELQHFFQVIWSNNDDFITICQIGPNLIIAFLWLLSSDLVLSLVLAERKS